MRKAEDNSQALAAFIARKTEIDTILARLTALSADHFGSDPDAVTWADVGTLSSYLKGLREISDAAFHEGEHAVRSLTLPSPRPGNPWRGSVW